METNAPEIDVEEIMNEIRADIRARRLDGTLVPFDDVPNPAGRMQVLPPGSFDEDRLTSFVNVLNGNYITPLDRPLGMGKKTFFKRVMRKLIRFYLKPVVDDQNAFNATTVNAINQLYTFAEEQQQLIDKQQAEISALRGQLDSQGQVDE